MMIQPSSSHLCHIVQTFDVSLMLMRFRASEQDIPHQCVDDSGILFICKQMLQRLSTGITQQHEDAYFVGCHSWQSRH